ncbi:MAG: nucleoside-diphosphate kinase [Bdellovibrionaceae bacterium]|nr:nucleoside-diphosphate kinase [Pseudobdellovibrionaceae bacterium]
MSKELTLSIIKPNAVKKNVIGDIISHFEKKHLQVAAIKKVLLSKSICEAFYAEHKERPFFGELVDFMASGPVVLMALHGENAVSLNREIMGATNPKEAKPDTLRALYGDSLGENAVHGSDSLDSAKREVDFFFKQEHRENTLKFLY